MSVYIFKLILNFRVSENQLLTFGCREEIKPEEKKNGANEWGWKIYIYIYIYINLWEWQYYFLTNLRYQDYQERKKLFSSDVSTCIFYELFYQL